ncbi:MAG: arylsulfatase [Verrucomicrobiota bacterium JB024]|nr:arylsulfatase [Verrucomicrobiota bacterium JB024]
MRKPHIILINVDQWRGDCLGIEDHPTVRTPYLDSLAQEGARFGRAYAATPSCIPARAALHTGLTPRSHGRVGYQDGVPWNYPVTLAGEFTRHGYQTQAVGKMHAYPERERLGFENVLLHDGYMHFGRRRDRTWESVDDYVPWLRERFSPDADYFEHGLNCNALTARPWDKPEHLHPTNWVVTQSINFLTRRDPRRPFFLYLSFHRPHPPLDPPAWAFEQCLDMPMTDPPVGDWTDIFQSTHTSHRADLNAGLLKPDQLRLARAGYYGHLLHIDHQINRFLEALEEFSLHRDCYVCFVSDHGELLGDHHLYRKFLPYEGSSRVPLILKGPPGCGIQAGSRINEPVELRDVMPTLLSCAGLPVPDVVEGRSFLPLARGETADWRTHLHGEHISFGDSSTQWLTDGHEKYIWFSQWDREQLFDLDEDPDELHDLSTTRPGRTAHWRQVLIKELEGREEGFTDSQRLIAGRPQYPCLSHLRKQMTQ